RALRGLSRDRARRPRGVGRPPGGRGGRRLLRAPAPARSRQRGGAPRPPPPPREGRAPGRGPRPGPRPPALGGPPAPARRPPLGATSDVLVDLQQIDVRPGGSPEVIVKTMSARVVPDVALNEVMSAEDTHIVFLSFDKGTLEASREIALAGRLGREALEPGDKR